MPSSLLHKWALKLWVIAICLGLGILAFALIVYPKIKEAREENRYRICPSNLRQIGLAMFMYAEAHQGRYPDGFAELLRGGGLRTDVLVCPFSKAVASKATSNDELAADLSKPEHCSYIYCGKGLTSDGDASIVLVYEPLENHSQEGMYALFGDGHVEFISATTAQQMIAQLQSGHNPPK